MEREEVEVAREPVSGGRTGGDLGDEVDITLHVERPVVDNEVVDAERVGVEPDPVTENETVSAQMAEEQVDRGREGDRDRGIDRDGDLGR